MKQEIETDDLERFVDEDEPIVNVEVPDLDDKGDTKTLSLKETTVDIEDKSLDTQTVKDKDLVDRVEVLAKVEPALIRVRRHNVTMSVREVIALVNGIITDIKELKGE